MTNAERIQAIKNTIGIMNIPASEGNIDKLFGIFRELNNVQQYLLATESAEEPEISIDAVEEEPEEVSE